jgi:hypothetical protein
LSDGGLSPAEQELFDSEYELSKAGYTANEVNDALAFQKLKNEIIASQDKCDEYAKARAIEKDKNWFRHPPLGYPNGSHNLMEVPPDNPNESVRLK